MPTFGAGQVDDQGLTVGASSQKDPEQRRLAVRVLASMATDPGDCACLLDLLGLTASEGKRS